MERISLRTLFGFLLLALLFPGGAFAQVNIPTFAIIPELTQEQTRTFLASSALQGSQTVPINVPAERLIITYSADAPFELWISFPTHEPFTGDAGSLRVNPLHVLKAKLTPQTQARISIDLTRSPAWYASRNAFVLHVLGQEGKIVEIHELTLEKPTFLATFKAYARQFFIDEPVLLSSINFLTGYHIADMSMTFLLGSLFLLIVAALLFTVKKRKMRMVLALSLLMVFLYDARVSLDLLRVTKADLAEWSDADLYRQLGPIYQIADFLKEERSHSPQPLKIAMCFDGTDFLQKQLRYLLYPTPVLRPEEGWNDATHAVFIDTDRGVMQEGMTSCGEEFVRMGELLHEFPQKSRVIRFAVPSL